MVGGLPELGCKLREVGAATAQTLSNLAVCLCALWMVLLLMCVHRRHNFLMPLCDAVFRNAVCLHIFHFVQTR